MGGTKGSNCWCTSVIYMVKKQLKIIKLQSDYERLDAKINSHIQKVHRYRLFLNPLVCSFSIYVVLFKIRLKYRYVPKPLSCFSGFFEKSYTQITLTI